MLRWTWISAVILFIDQLTKWQAEDYLTQLGHSYFIFPHLNFTLAYNTGAAFGLLGGQSGWQRWFFAILAIGVSVYLLIWLKKLKENQRWTAIGLTLVLGGAIGNLVDRVLYGKVTDFIDFYFIPFWQTDVYHFATFNVADIGISVGATILVISSLFYTEEDDVRK